jgi:hypothetical protein
MRLSSYVLVLLVLAGFTNPPEARGDPVMLRVKPLLCITDERTPQCEMSLIVDWRSRRPGNYCLYNDLSDEPLDCWNQQSSGRHVEDRVVVRSFTYWLTVGSLDTRLAEAMVEVMSTHSSDRRRHRRSRHVWSIL